MHNPSLINGFFDPLTLSIYETAPNESWRSIYDVTQHSKMFPEKEHDKLIEDWRLYADLTNKHEHDHFIRHTSSELGVLYTILLLLKHQSLSSYIISSEELVTNSKLREFRAGIPEFLNLVVYCLFGNATSMTQQQAVEILNEFYRICFGIDNLFVAGLPDAPACPTNYMGYKNILETSAILNEYKVATLGGFTNEEIEKLLRTKARDKELYFFLFKYLEQEIRYLPICKMLCCYALEAQVPLFGSNEKDKIYWEEIHPGWRIYNFTQYLKQLLIENKFHDADWLNKYPYSQYIMNVQALFLEMLDTLPGKVFGQKSFYQRGKENNYLNLESIIIKLTPAYGEYFKTIISVAYNPILEHLFDSYNLFLKECIAYPLNYYSRAFVKGEKGFDFEGFPKIQPNIFSENLATNKPISPTAALFSIQEGKFRSIYFNKKDVYSAVRVKAEDMIFEGIFNGETKEHTLTKILNFAGWDSDRYQKIYDKQIKKFVESFYNSYKF